MSQGRKGSIVITDGQAFSLNYYLMFNRNAIFNGQIWRIISFIFVYPTGSNIAFTLLAIYFFFWTGSAVEGYWGKARFNLYYYGQRIFI